MSNSDDIVDRARRRWTQWYEGEVDVTDYLAEVIPPLCDEIERLRAELEACQQRLWQRIEMSDG